MPLVTTEPRDGITYFVDGVPVSERTYTYPHPQKEFTLRNTGTRRIIYSLGIYENIIVNPGETDTRMFPEGITSFKIRAEYGYQSFSMSSVQLPVEESNIPERVGTLETELASVTRSLDTKANESDLVSLSSQLADKANAKTNTFNKKTFGTFNDAAVLAAMGNTDDPRAGVLGVNSVSELSEYTDRDSVGFYASNRGINPTVKAATGTITYTANSVQVTGTTLTGLEDVVEGMVIDTNHSPNGWVSVVKSVDLSTQTIYIKEGWYEKILGGSIAPSIPPNNTGFDINRVSKIWAINNNVYLNPEHETNKAVGQEIGLFNRKGGTAELGGIDIGNFNKKSTYGVRVRKANSSVEGGFAKGYIAQDAETGYEFLTGTASHLLLASFLSGDLTDKGYYITAGGTVPKLRLNTQVYVNGETTLKDPGNKIIIINKTVQESFNLPSPAGRTGEIIFVLNAGSAVANIKTSANENIITGSINSILVGITPKSSAIFASDGSSWLSLFGNFDNREGYFKQSGGSIKGNTIIDGTFSVLNSAPINHNGRNVVNVRVGAVSPQSSADFIGQQYVDSTSKTGYLAVSVGGGVNDWKQITV